ncbi:ABC-type sugar transport system permease subunit [Caldalkalibacillus uzonensis]|uniref:ABC-type sugar transport system permease subunit n=1 Tax=Caldalkalibacillus uzonensis TaxID=353224 RepID=A0ABU0CQH1_9BACI|nr:sugar ABC transporter permease [Caldalkalibacillus uzonensis]MDQ0338665.1 ABC-type sugar transport system permease subunit [Caldalkalibacillus uzonensis]
MSFQDINVLQPERARFVGIENWINGIQDPLFWKALFNILYNQSIFIALTFVISLGMALLLKEITAGAGIFRTIYFLPVITSIAVAMIIFEFLASPNGPVQRIMMSVGLLDGPVFWTFSKWLPMPLLAIFNSWKWFAVQMMIFLGGLLTINKELYEAARVDGASWWTQFFRITLPLLKPQILFVMTMNVINGMQMFTEVFMIFDLQGGPYHAGLTPVLYLYKTGFDDMSMGYAATLGLLLAVVILILTTIQWKLINRHGES